MTDPTSTRPGIDEFMRFERVWSVEETERGLLARLHGETLSVDLIRDDVIRVKISRGGVFDESPSFAVCADPLSDEVAFTLESDDHVVRLRGSCLVVSLWLDPFRLDVHRPDGSVIAEAARDDGGRFWGYATLNDAFAVRRRRGPNDAVYGLGEKTGSHDRRDATSRCGTRTCWIPTGRPNSSPAGRTTIPVPTAPARSSIPTTSRSRSSTTSRTRREP